MNRKRFLMSCAATVLGAVCTTQHAQAVSVQFDGAATMMMVNNAPAGGQPATTVLQFPAAKNVGGTNWDVSAGQVILVVTPGAGATTNSASLTLTGLPGNPLVFTYDPIGSSSAVTVSFSSSPNTFDPIKPAMDSASLDGTYSDQPIALGANPQLVAKTNGATFGTVGPLAPANGAFSGSIGPIQDTNVLGVTSLSGVFSFTFSGTQKAGDTVTLPNSAVVQSAVPEPQRLGLWAVGAALLIGYTAQRRVRRMLT